MVERDPQPRDRPPVSRSDDADSNPESPASRDVEAERRVGGEAFAVHLAEHGAGVEVVVDLDVGLGVGGAQDAPDVLHDTAFEREREREEQRVKAGAVEPFAEIGAGRQQELAAS